MAISPPTRLALLLTALLLSSCALLAPSYSSQTTTQQWPNFNRQLSEQTGWLVFGEQTSETGIVFYPGGKVEPQAYGRLSNALSQRTDSLVVIVPMPLDLAVFGKNRAKAIPEQFSDIQHWLIGGHSLGGTMAASVAFEQADVWQGLFLLASYPQDKHDFSGSNLEVISLIGDRDGLISLVRWQASLSLLPNSAEHQIIKGGNHAYFADYGDQDGDGVAMISQQQQFEQSLEALVAWFESTTAK